MPLAAFVLAGLLLGGAPTRFEAHRDTCFKGDSLCASEQLAGMTARVGGESHPFLFGVGAAVGIGKRPGEWPFKVLWPEFLLRLDRSVNRHLQYGLQGALGGDFLNQSTARAIGFSTNFLGTLTYKWVRTALGASYISLGAGWNYALTLREGACKGQAQCTDLITAGYHSISYEAFSSLTSLKGEVRTKYSDFDMFAGLVAAGYEMERLLGMSVKFELRAESSFYDGRYFPRYSLGLWFSPARVAES